MVCMQWLTGRHNTVLVSRAILKEIIVASSVYYKLRQVLQSAVIITNCDSACALYR